MFIASGCSSTGGYKRKLREKPHIAFIIDDVGFHTAYKREVLNIKAPITYAIIPYSPSGRLMARFLYKHGCEIMLHLPMESKKARENKDKGLISVNMERQDIRKVIRESLASLPYIKGVNNHKGSKATADYRVMKIVLQELKKKKLFFVDSLTTNDSVCGQVAESLRMTIGARDVFLDNKREPEYIKEQIRRLEKIALKHGEAIGIGHYNKVTLEVLALTVPSLKKKGIRIVFVSELL